MDENRLLHLSKQGDLEARKILFKLQSRKATNIAPDSYLSLRFFTRSNLFETFYYTNASVARDAQVGYGFYGHLSGGGSIQQHQKGAGVPHNLYPLIKIYFSRNQK